MSRKLRVKSSSIRPTERCLPKEIAYVRMTLLLRAIYWDQKICIQNTVRDLKALRFYVGGDNVPENLPLLAIISVIVPSQ